MKICNKILQIGLLSAALGSLFGCSVAGRLQRQQMTASLSQLTRAERQERQQDYRPQVVKLQRDSNTFFLAPVDTLADGERVMALQIEQVTVVAKMRSIPERNGRVVLDFIVTLPKQLLGKSRSVVITPILHKPDESVALEDLMIRGKMFYTTGDISVVDNMITHAILFNKDMIASYGLDNPYDLVASNNWTLETFGALVKQVGQDMDNNGVYDENDLYGLLTWNDPMTAILAAAGEKIASINDRGEIELTLYNERVLNLYDTFENIVFDQAHVYNYQYDNSTGAGTPSKVWNTNRDTIFNSNRAVFYLNTVTTAERHRDSELDFGILPYPKLNSEQKEYGHNVSAFHCQFLCVPELVKSYERSGIVLEALAYQGKKLLTPAYYDQTLIGKSVRDEESVAMLDIIFASRVFDVGIYYNIGTYKNELGRLFVTRSALSSIYETYRSSAEATINAINETFAKSMGE